MSVPANSIKVGGEEIDFVGASMLSITRGVDASSWEFFTNTPDRFRALANPVKIEITTPDKTSLRAVTLELENWYITEISPQAGGLFKVVVEDCRFTAQFKKLSKSFNVKTIDGNYRPSSLDGKTRFSVASALAKVIAEFGLASELDKELNNPKPGQSVNASSERLPDNLGTSKGGGFFGATTRESLWPMLNLIRADTVPTRKGALRIVDRLADKTAALDQLAYEGNVAPRDIHWQAFETLTVLLEQRFERYFEIFDGTAPPVKAWDYAVENVVPFPVPNAQIGDDPIAWKTWDYFLGQIGLSDSEWRARFLKETVIPDNPAVAADAVLQKRMLEERGRENYRLSWRVKFLTDVARLWADSRFGRLGKEGKSVKGGYIFMDHFKRIRNRQDLRPNAPATLFSENHNYTLTELAPFVAQWLTDGSDDLVFGLEPANVVVERRAVFPGLLNKPISFGDPNAIVTDQGEIDLEGALPALQFRFYGRVYFHALLSDDHGPEDCERFHKVSTPFMSGAPNAELVVRSEQLTANWGNTGNAFKGNLLNAAEIAEEVEAIKNRFISAYQNGKAGVMYCAGIEALLDDRYWPSGNIYAAHIEIGTDGSGFTIRTRFDVLPEVDNPVSDTDYMGRPLKSGRSPELVG